MKSVCLVFLLLLCPVFPKINRDTDFWRVYLYLFNSLQRETSGTEWKTGTASRATIYCAAIQPTCWYIVTLSAFKQHPLTKTKKTAKLVESLTCLQSNVIACPRYKKTPLVQDCSLTDRSSIVARDSFFQHAVSIQRVIALNEKTWHPVTVSLYSVRCLVFFLILLCGKSLQN